MSMKGKSYRIADNGVIIPICQRCGKSSGFYPKEYPDNTGCMCTNPRFTGTAKQLQNKRLARLGIEGFNV